MGSQASNLKLETCVINRSGMSISKQFLLSKFLEMNQEEIEQLGRKKNIERVPEWSVEDVLNWLKKIGFLDFVPVFEQCGVDGDILLLLKDKDIKEDLGMTNGIMRKRFMRELKNLRKSSDYNCCNGAEISDFLSMIGADFREYTYNLVTKDMSVEYMKKLGAADLQDMLKEVGIENLVHQHKIVEAINIVDEDIRSNDSSCSSDTEYDVYLTYPKSNGAELASLIKMQLGMRGIAVFSDSHESNHLSKHKLRIIQETKHFVLVLPPGGLDSCLIENKESEKLHAEIVAALSSDVNIVPVTDNFQWPDQEELMEDVRAVSYFNSVRWVHDYQDACISKLERFLRGESLLRIESPFSTLNRSPFPRSPRRSGISTPTGTPKKYSTPVNQTLVSNMLMVPRSVGRSNLSLVSTDSGLDSRC